MLTCPVLSARTVFSARVLCFQLLFIARGIYSTLQCQNAAPVYSAWDTAQIYSTFLQREQAPQGHGAAFWAILVSFFLHSCPCPRPHRRAPNLTFGATGTSNTLRPPQRGVTCASCAQIGFPIRCPRIGISKPRPNLRTLTSIAFWRMKRQRRSLTRNCANALYGLIHSYIVCPGCAHCLMHCPSLYAECTSTCTLLTLLVPCL